MRTRDEIYNRIKDSFSQRKGVSYGEYNVQLSILEVLLDIRDLLKDKKK